MVVHRFTPDDVKHRSFTLWSVVPSCARVRALCVMPSGGPAQVVAAALQPAVPGSEMGAWCSSQ